MERAHDLVWMATARDQQLIEAFAAVLREARLRKGLSQEQLAGAAGVDRTYVGMLEGGKRQPTLSVLCALSEPLGLAPGILVQRAYKILKAAS
jgi:transcriptional regulator with XRE-family HTH domain